jgi:hypothetical protein
VNLLAAAHAARDSALGAHGVHWDVAVAAVGAVASGVVLGKARDYFCQLTG